MPSKKEYTVEFKNQAVRLVERDESRRQVYELSWPCFPHGGGCLPIMPHWRFRSRWR